MCLCACVLLLRACALMYMKVYLNESEDQIEAKYKFPLDAMAAVCGFEAFINGKHVVGKVKEKVCISLSLSLCVWACRYKIHRLYTHQPAITPTCNYSVHVYVCRRRLRKSTLKPYRVVTVPT